MKSQFFEPEMNERCSSTIPLNRAKILGKNLKWHERGTIGHFLAIRGPLFNVADRARTQGTLWVGQFFKSGTVPVREGPEVLLLEGQRRVGRALKVGLGGLNAGQRVVVDDLPFGRGRRTSRTPI